MSDKSEGPMRRERDGRMIAVCPTCGIKFFSSLIVGPSATMNVEDYSTNCPNGHIHSYDWDPHITDGLTHPAINPAIRLHPLSRV